MPASTLATKPTTQTALICPSSPSYGTPCTAFLLTAVGQRLLLDRLEELSHVPATHWYERVTEAPGAGPRPDTTRLTILIDRAELSGTTSALCGSDT